MAGLVVAVEGGAQSKTEQLDLKYKLAYICIQHIVITFLFDMLFTTNLPSHPATAGAFIPCGFLCGVLEKECVC